MSEREGILVPRQVIANLLASSMVHYTQEVPDGDDGHVYEVDLGCGYCQSWHHDDECPIKYLEQLLGQ